ncbi:hypothetical protein [Cellulosilyticum lentocellum]|uniref:Uncharacterized protein n=1 Tax=Cellulosilyticum lentocellum (strain ATCC 49066 / DSM 5427 / NCIMB 11756 / RHM5) TaxID=642492 RepID=F2JNW2_CELLD|nr:hypothetical protein [Cellulosilyticum lentocellum]ADZ82460.1 hypothetical protein Clole_0727 [Cellulosilyticum lentocellum DSM 5427]
MGKSVRRINPETKEEKTFKSIREAAISISNGTEKTPWRSHKLGQAIKNEEIYRGYKWEIIDEEIVYEDWMIEYIRKNYKGIESLESIAKAIGRTKIQVKNKVTYMGLKEKANIWEVDTRLIDYKAFKNKVDRIKKKVHKGAKVKVNIYNEDTEADGRKTKRTIEAEVDGAYRCFVNVIVNGIRRSYRYEEILEVEEEIR